MFFFFFFFFFLQKTVFNISSKLVPRKQFLTFEANFLQYEMSKPVYLCVCVCVCVCVCIIIIIILRGGEGVEEKI